MRYIFMLFLMSCTMVEYKGPVSKNFDGKRFISDGIGEKSLGDLLKWKFTGDKKEWPKWIEDSEYEAPIAKLEEGVHVTFVNHATVLVQMNGLNIITDPVYSERVSPVSFAGPKRVRGPGVKFENLPKIDAVLISHNHFDHMDVDTIKKIYDRDGAIVLVGLGNERTLNDAGIDKVKELDWDQSHVIGDVKFTFTEVAHWSRRVFVGTNRTLWGGFVIEGNKKVYFAGDTGYRKHFKETYEKYGKMDISLIPIGAYAPRWFMKAQHINPKEAVMAHMDLKSDFSIGIHFGTFQLTDEGIDEPSKELAIALKENDINIEKFVVPGFGETFKF